MKTLFFHRFVVFVMISVTSVNKRAFDPKQTFVAFLSFCAAIGGPRCLSTKVALGSLSLCLSSPEIFHKAVQGSLGLLAKQLQGSLGLLARNRPQQAVKGTLDWGPARGGEFYKTVGQSDRAS